MIDRGGRALQLSGWGLAALLAGASFGEGGAAPTALLLIHTGLAALAAIAIGRESRRDGPAAAPARGPFALLLLFFAVSVAGAVAAPYGFAAWLVLIEQLGFLATVWLAARGGEAFLVRAAPIVLFGAALQGAIAVGQRLELGEARPAGTFFNTNHLAAWLVAALTLGLGVWPARPTARSIALRTGAATVALVGLLLCGSRGALIGLAVSGGCLLALVVGAGVPRAVRRAALAAACAVALVAIAGVAVRLRTADPFLYHRVRIWRAALASVAQAPLTGTGPGQFAAAAANLNFPLEEGPLRYERSFVSPHSDLLRALCELGFPGAIVAFAILGAAVGSIGGKLTRGARSPATGAGAAVLAGLLAQSAVDDLTDRPAIFLLFAAVAGALLSTPRAGRARWPAGLRAAAILAVATLLVVGEIAPWLAWRSLGGAREAIPRGRLDAAQRRRLDDAIARNPFHPDLWLRRAEDVAGNGLDWDASGYATAREAAERAVRLQPADARYRLGVARIEALACTTLFGDVATRERALRAYAQAEELARHDPFLPLEQGRFLLAAGDPSGARSAAARVLAIEPEAVPARLLFAQAIAVDTSAGGPARAREVLRDADATVERWRDVPQDTPYARALLRMDTEWRRSVDSGAPSP